ncbi:hypothetical protein IX30_10580, partial [Neisseria gonorrhoeae]
IPALQWDIGGSGAVFPSLALFLLCFIIGMHNTGMTLLPGGAIRSTHMARHGSRLGHRNPARAVL